MLKTFVLLKTTRCNFRYFCHRSTTLLVIWSQVVPEYDDDKIDYGYGFASWGDEKGLGKHLILNGIQR